MQQKTFKDALFGKPALPGAKNRVEAYRLLLQDEDENDLLEVGLLPTSVTGRTPFTQGSTKAWSTVISNSVFHTASTPLALMQLKIIQDLPLSVSGLLLLAAWGSAAGLNSWANYYKYIERSTPEFGLKYVTDANFIPEPGILYFFNVIDGIEDGNNNGLHYLTCVEENKDIRYDITYVEKSLNNELKNLLKTRQFNRLTKAHSKAIKAAVAFNHIPKLMADADFIPGKREDYWFFPLCLIATLPALSAGFVLGYTSTEGQSESNRIIAAALFALFNYIKNLLCDMPVIANAYGKNEALGNMGPVALQPGVWLIINAAVLFLLRNIAPAFLALTTWAGLVNESILPPWSGFIGGFVLFPFITSSFLLFTMLALQKLNLQKGLKDSPNDSWLQKWLFNQSAITNSLGLEHSLTHWKNPLAQFFAEILGGRYLTVSGPLKAGLSPQNNASFITFMKALGDFALIFGPTFEVSASFLSFFFNDSANEAKLPLAFALLSLGACAAILGAITQWPNFVECCERRQQDLGINKHKNFIAHSSQDDRPVNNDECGNISIYLASKDPKYAQINEGDRLRNVTFKDLRHFGMTHAIFYDIPSTNTNDDNAMPTLSLN